MKKIALAGLLALSMSSLSAKETKILPILTDDNYCFNPSVALIGGYTKYDEADNGTSMYGAELSIACPALQLQSLNIRQQISFVHATEKDKFSSNSLEFNPHVIFKADDKLQVGVGPGVGIVFADADGETDTVIGLNIGASANYDVTPRVFVGAEARYQWGLADADFNGNKVSLDNYRTLLKVGYHF